MHIPDRKKDELNDRHSVPLRFAHRCGKESQSHMSTTCSGQATRLTDLMRVFIASIAAIHAPLFHVVCCWYRAMEGECFRFCKTKPGTARNQFRFNRAAAGINASNLFETMTYTGLTRLSNSSALLTYNRYFADWLQAMRTRLAFHFI